MKFYQILLLFCPIIISSVIDFSILSLDEIPTAQDISYLQCHDVAELNLKYFHMSDFVKQEIPKTFVLKIPHGQVWAKALNPDEGKAYAICSSGFIIKELIWPWSPIAKQKRLNINLNSVEKIQGKVAVIGQEGAFNYYHWMLEVLPKLCLLKMHNIEFDFLYTPASKPFMQETLKLLGIDLEKVIEPHGIHDYIEADELVIPSFVSVSCYSPNWVIDFLRDQFLPKIDKLKVAKNFSKKVFISRQKAEHRKITNESDIFDILKQYGFELYNLEDLSFLDQIGLFNNADVIVAPHGAGLANLVFCNKKTRIVEIYQEHEDYTFWHLSNAIGLNHKCIKTIEFQKDGGYSDT